MDIHNAALADEVDVLNAIYGEGLVIATFSDSHHTTISIRLPALSFSFQIRVLDDYPESPPDVLGIDDLVQSLDPNVQQSCVYFGACVRAVYSPEQVCLFDAINEFDTICSSLGYYSQKSDDSQAVSEHKSVRRAEILRDLAIRARPKTGKNADGRPCADSQFDVVDCSACLEPFFRVDIATLKCRHSLCPECLHDGVISMFKAGSELRCCGDAIPVRTIRQHGNLEEEFLEGFILWLQELHTPNPTYCPWEDCLFYIPRRFIKDDYAKCPFCKRRMCMGCKRKEHGGMCRQDKQLKKLIEKENWKFCSCGQLVQKSMGCNHMTCRCGAEFCYRCGTPYDGRKPACECGLFA
jgi:hypothetical protein